VWFGVTSVFGASPACFGVVAGRRVKVPEATPEGSLRPVGGGQAREAGAVGVGTTLGLSGSVRRLSDVRESESHVACADRPLIGAAVPPCAGIDRTGFDPQRRGPDASWFSPHGP